MSVIKSKEGVPVVGDFKSATGTPIILDIRAGNFAAYALDNAESVRTIGDASALLTTKGDLLTYSSAQVRLPIGSLGEVLMVSAGGEAEWAALPGGGDMLSTNNLSDVANAATARTNLGIGNVENTALSTWAGSANLTTLGTISSGVWNGTAIANGYVAAALTGKTYNGLTVTATTGTLTVTGSSVLTVSANATLTNGTHSGTNTGDETEARLGSLIGATTEKATPTGADSLGLVDSAASNVLKKFTWTNVKASLKTYFDGLYDAIGAAAAVISDTAYNATTWDGVTTVAPSKNAVRDVVEGIGVAVAAAEAAAIASSAASLLSHTSDTANPHAVTKSQVGLGSVENTALSTWAGTTNITTLGTITSLVATTADINGGTVDGAVIGGASAAAGTFTTLTSTGQTILASSSGNVGIGVTPSYKLDVNGAVNALSYRATSGTDATAATHYVFQAANPGVYLHKTLANVKAEIVYNALSDFTTWDYQKAGVVGWYNVAGGPGASSYHHGYRSFMADVRFGNEIAIPHNADRLFFRRYAEAYQAWVEVSLTSHTHSYLPLAGGELTGSLGIGVTPTAGKLHVSSLSDAPVLYIDHQKNDGGSASSFKIYDSRGYAGNNTGVSAHILSWYTDANDTGDILLCEQFNGTSAYPFRVKMNGTSVFGGYVGIGTASPGTPLDVVGKVRTNNVFESTVATGTAPIKVASTTPAEGLSIDGNAATATLAAAATLAADSTLFGGNLPSHFATAASISGTNDTIAKFTAAGAVGNSVMTEASGKIGIGTAPSAFIHALGTTEQARFGYDASNYWKATVGATGGMTLAGVGTGGALTLTPTAGQNLNVSLSTTGDFAVNTNQLYVDTSAGNVGIGRTPTDHKLEVAGGIVGKGGATGHHVDVYISEAAGSGDTKTTTGIQAAVTAAIAGTNGSNTVVFGAKKYTINDTLSVLLSSSKTIRIIGGGGKAHRYNPNTTDSSGTVIEANFTSGNADIVFHFYSTEALDAANDADRAYFELSDMVIKPVSTTCTDSIGVKIGTTDGKQVNSDKYSVLRNLNVSGFPNGALEIQSAKNLHVENCLFAMELGDGAITKPAILIQHQSASTFTGEMTFVNVTAYGTGSAGAIELKATVAPTGHNGLRGIRFIGCTFYYGPVCMLLYASGGGQLHDIFISSCQHEGNAGVDDSTAQGISLHATGTGSVITGVSISDGYMVAWSDYGVLLYGQSPGEVRNVTITNNYIGLCETNGIYVEELCKGIVIANNTLYDCCTGTYDQAVITLANSTAALTPGMFVVEGNTHTDTDTTAKPEYIVRVGGSQVNTISEYVIRGNVGRCYGSAAVDPSGSSTSNKTIDGNWRRTAL